MVAYTHVAAVGRDAVMVEQENVVGADDHELGEIVDEAAGRNVLGDEVLTDDGRRLGVVTDVILDVASGEVVGYELKGDENLQAHAGRPMLVPIPATLAVSGTALMVPAQVEPFIRDDLTGFGGAVDEFRNELPKVHDAAQ
jgi:sporulation protein YlmC with PRC-barrel domain